MSDDLDQFGLHRPSLLALAYRMLGDLGAAEDIVQTAWLRWSGRDRTRGVDNPKAYLIRVVTRLCLNELDSAHARREEARGDRLPEPVNLADAGLTRVEALDRISMAFLVLLQRLTAAERAVLVLHEVFDFSHDEVAGLLDRSPAACRQLLSRARTQVLRSRRNQPAPREIHRRLLQAFLQAAASGDVEAVAALLADEAILVVDAGPDGGRYGRVRNLPGPIVGARRVSAFIASVAPQGAAGLTARECDVNGEPAVLLLRDGRPITAIVLSIAEEAIDAIFMHADPARLRRLGRHLSRRRQNPQG